MDFSKVEDIIKYEFKDKKLLQKSLTHSSYINEKSHNKNNERLEFLGDAVLELVISTYLYNQYSKLSEGKLTKLRSKIVCTESLSKVSKQINIGSYILMGKGEENTGGRKRKSILANTFEAIIGAIYIDGGIIEAEKFILTQLYQNIMDAIKGRLIFDYKTKLQEVIQQDTKNVIDYLIIKEEGPEHNKIFYIDLLLNQKKIGRGIGNSKKEAEQKAAYHGLIYLRKIDE